MRTLLNKTGAAEIKKSTNNFKFKKLIEDEAELFCQENDKFLGHYIPNFFDGIKSNFFFQQLSKLKFNHSDRTSGISCDSIIFGSAASDPLKNLPARNVRNDPATNTVWLNLLKYANQC